MPESHSEDAVAEMRNLERLGNTARFVLFHIGENGPSTSTDLVHASPGDIRDRGIFKALHLLERTERIEVIEEGPPKIFDLTPFGWISAAYYLGLSQKKTSNSSKDLLAPQAGRFARRVRNAFTAKAD